MQNNTASDTTTFASTGSNKGKSGGQSKKTKMQTPEEMQKHFAKVFGGQNAKFFGNPTFVTEAPPVDWNNFETMFKGPAIYVPAEKSAPTKYVKSTYNFVNSKVENAAIGNRGPVTFNKTKEVFKEGAKKSEYNISGGNFAQANIGGKADISNTKSSIGAGQVAGDGTGAALPSELLDISKVSFPFSPEEYLAKLLRTGISAEELISLLEKDYSLVDLSYSLPTSDKKRAVLVETMLKIADME